MVEILIREKPVEVKDEKKARAAKPQALQALDAILAEGPKDADANVDQIHARVGSLRTYLPIGRATVADALAIAEAEGEIVMEQRSVPDTRGNPQRNNFYKRPGQGEESQAETISAIMGHPGGTVDGINGLTQAVKAAQRSNN